MILSIPKIRGSCLHASTDVLTGTPTLNSNWRSIF